METFNLQVNGATPQPKNDIDELEFGLLMNKVMSGTTTKRPSDKSANDIEVEVILAQASSLAKMNDQYTQTYVIKGTQSLYELLGAIYNYSLQIDASPLRDHVIQKMRDKLLSDHQIKTQANTPWITTVLRFILPTDRQTAYSYSKVLQVAYEDNTASDELPKYIKERGGIAKITTTAETAANAKKIKEHKQAKLKLLKKILLANAKQTSRKASLDMHSMIDLVPKGKSEGDFDFAICYRAEAGEAKIIRFLSLPAQMEDSILSAVADAVIEDDLEATQAKLDDFRAKLGITSGWGMEPGEKGYKLPGVPDISALERIQEAKLNDVTNAG